MLIGTEAIIQTKQLTFRWIYWTEHKSGATGVEVFSCKNNGQRYRKLLSVDLHWPNSLVVNEDKLYIGDGRGKIIATDIEGWFKFNPFLTTGIRLNHSNFLYQRTLYYSEVRRIIMKSGCTNTKKTYRQLSEQLFSKRLPLIHLNLTKYMNMCLKGINIKTPKP